VKIARMCRKGSIMSCCHQGYLVPYKFEDGGLIPSGLIPSVMYSGVLYVTKLYCTNGRAIINVEAANNGR